MFKLSKQWETKSQPWDDIASELEKIDFSKIKVKTKVNPLENEFPLTPLASKVSTVSTVPSYEQGFNDCKKSSNRLSNGRRFSRISCPH